MNQPPVIVAGELGRLEPEADPVGRLLLAVLLRHAGHPEDSLEVSSAVDLPRHLLPATEHERAMLCCHRAAAMMDVFEKTCDRALLQGARKYLNRGWAIAKERSIPGQEELSAAYQRWHKLAEECPDGPA